jgi:hypothetical protein
MSAAARAGSEALVIGLPMTIIVAPLSIATLGVAVLDWSSSRSTGLMPGVTRMSDGAA